MKKSDLKTGMKVTIRNGAIYFVLLDVIAESPFGGYQNLDILSNGDDILYLCDYNDSLCDCDDEKYDIIKIEIPKCYNDVLNIEAEYRIIWERSYREMTLREIEKELGYSVRIIGGTE